MEHRARVFQSPRYIQQQGALEHIGEHVRAAFPGLDTSKAALITSKRLRDRYLDQLTRSVPSPVILEFSGECTRANAEALLAQLRDKGCQFVIGFGAGKLLDITKMVARALGLPMVIVPSLASTDAPCLSVSIVYTADGKYDSCEFLPRALDLVIVDSRVIAESPVKFLVAGFGDAMATKYEADAVAANPRAATWMSPLGANRPPLIAAAIGAACLDTLFTRAAAAKADCEAGRVTDDLEAVIEANTLLSGLGVESGGLAAAHGFHNALTALPETHGRMHGEKVALGTMVQLLCEGREDEARRVAVFNKSVGLPLCLADLNVELDDAKLQTLVDETLVEGSISWNLAGVDADKVRAAILAADALGRTVKAGSV